MVVQVEEASSELLTFSREEGRASEEWRTLTLFARETEQNGAWVIRDEKPKPLGSSLGST